MAADSTMTTFRNTLRRLANEQDADERLRLSDTLASELEVAFNRQGNQNQLALSDTEEVLLTKIDRLNAQVGDNNTLISTFLAAFPAQFSTFQGEMRAAVEATAHSLGKFSDDIQELKEGQSTYTARLEEMDARHGGQWEEAMTFYRQMEGRLNVKRERLDKHDREIAEIKREVAELKAWREAQDHGA